MTWTAARLLDDGTGAIAAPLQTAGRCPGRGRPARRPRWSGWANRTSVTCSPVLPPESCRSPTRHSTAGPARGPSPTCVTCWSAAACCPQPTGSCASSRHGWTGGWTPWPGTPTCGCCASSGCGTSCPAMRARAAAGPLRTTAGQYARTRFIQAQAFLTWAAALGRAAVRPHPGPHRRLLRQPRHPPARGRPRVPDLGRRARPHPPPPGHPPPAALYRAGHHPAAPPGPAAPLRHRHRPSRSGPAPPPA